MFAPPPPAGTAEDPEIAALRPHLGRVVQRMVETGLALVHRYDRQAYGPRKKKATKPARPGADPPPAAADDPPAKPARKRRPRTEP
jgi:hypothetical protein